MKIQVTHEEVRDMVRAKYGLPYETEVEIVSSTINPQVHQVIRVVESVDFTGREKIAAIKLVREHYLADGYCPGLFNAKWIIENWAKFKSFAKAIGRLPSERELDNLIKPL
jgi:hypothetical protein